MSTLIAWLIFAAGAWIAWREVGEVGHWSLSPMQRGFFRLWIVISAVWVALIWALSSMNGAEFDMSALIPPLVLLALGASIGWVLSGFRRR